MFKEICSIFHDCHDCSIDVQGEEGPANSSPTEGSSTHHACLATFFSLGLVKKKDVQGEELGD